MWVYKKKKSSEVAYAITVRCILYRIDRNNMIRWTVKFKCQLEAFCFLQHFHLKLSHFGENSLSEKPLKKKCNTWFQLLQPWRKEIKDVFKSGLFIMFSLLARWIKFSISISNFFLSYAPLFFFLFPRGNRSPRPHLWQLPNTLSAL